MTALLVLLVLIAAPVQAAVTTALFRDPLAAPVLPAVLVAAWAMMRDPRETWPAILLPAVVLGAASEERVGWYLLALTPGPLLAVAAARSIKPHVTGLWRRLALGTGVAAGSALTYAVVLAVAGGVGGELPARADALAAATLGSALLAVLAGLAFWPLRPRRRGLFA